MNPNKIKYAVLAFLAGAGLVGQTVHGTPVTVTNFSFEADVQAQGSESGPPFTGWTGVGSFEAIRYPNTPGDFNTDPLTAPGDGHQIAEANDNSLLYQDVGPVQPLTTYTLTVAVGARASVSYGEGAGIIQLVNGTTQAGTVLAQTAIDNTGLGGIFTNFSVVFTTSSTVSGDLTIVLDNTTAVQICFDNVRLDATPAGFIPAASKPTFSPAAAFPGDTVTATEVATGPSPLYYEWQTDSGSGGTNWTTVTGFSASPTYTFSTTGDTFPGYEYRVVVSNTYGTNLSAAGTLVITNGAPVVAQNPIPQTEYFIVGETASFTAAFTGTRPLSYQWQVDNGDGPVNVTNGTYNSPTLVITNLQLSDAGLAYTCVASNSYGTTPTTAAGMLNVDSAPGPDSFGNIVLEDNESSSTSFQPTYSLANNSLIAGMLPGAETPGAGSFQLEGSAGIPVLTDGLYPPTANNYSIMATVGDNGGATLTYSLNTAVAPLGYDLSGIVAYGGWLNGGRDQMAGNIYYSTAQNPTNFIQCGTYDYLPPYAANPASRVTVVPSTGWLATNVAAVRFDFTGQDVENGYEGLSELQVLGQAVFVPGITIQRSGADIKLTWPGGTLLQATTVNGPWTTNTASSPYTFSPTGIAKFFKLLVQ